MKTLEDYADLSFKIFCEHIAASCEILADKPQTQGLTGKQALLRLADSLRNGITDKKV